MIPFLLKSPSFLSFPHHDLQRSFDFTAPAHGCRSNWSKHAFLLVIKGWIKPWLFFSVRFHCKLHEGAARSHRWWPPVLLVWWCPGSRSDCTRCPLDERVRSFHWRCCWCSSPHSCSCGRLNEAQTPTLTRHTDYRWLSVKGSTAYGDIITLKNKGALLPSMVPFHSTKRFFRLLKCSCSLKCSLRNQKNGSYMASQQTQFWNLYF